MSWTHSYFNGITSVATIWSSELARLTGHSRLDDLTLLSLARVVNIYGLVSKVRKWCPQCLRDCERGGVPYGQLLWEIAAVDACPVHAIRLVNRCKCGGTGVLAPTAKRLPHICQHCCRQLADSRRSRKATVVELRRARLLADLLEHQDFDHGSWPISGISEFLIGAARAHFEGELALMSRALGLSKVTLHGWVRDGRRPTLQRIVALADIFDCSIRSVLQGQAPHTRMRARLSLGSRRRQSGIISPEFRKRLPEKLLAIQRRSKAISLAQAARELGVSRVFLRSNYRTACEAIVGNFKRRRIADARERKDRLVATFRSKATAMATSGTKLTLKRVMGLSTELFRFGRECRAVIADILCESARKSRT